MRKRAKKKQKRHRDGYAFRKRAVEREKSNDNDECEQKRTNSENMIFGYILHSYGDDNNICDIVLQEFNMKSTTKEHRTLNLIMAITVYTGPSL